MSHALLPPSSAEQWVNCPGWVVMTDGLKDAEESEAARIGTKVHDLCATLLLGEVSNQSIIYTQEEQDSAKVFVDYCIGLQETYPLSKVFIEQKFEMPNIHRENSGTPDFVLINTHRKIIHVIDYKHGMGIVDPYWNWQLLNYLAGVLYTNGYEHTDFNCTLTIVQPRAFHRFGVVRSWSPNNADIQSAIVRLRSSAYEAIDGIPTCAAGSHCKYCKALFICPSAIQKGMSIFDTITSAQRLVHTGSSIGLQFSLVSDAITLLSNVKTSLEAQIVSRLRSGYNVANYRLEPKSGNLEWTISDEEAIILGDLMGIDIRKASTPITPTQAKNKGLDVEGLTTRKSNVKLEKFDLMNAKRVF